MERQSSPGLLLLLPDRRHHPELTRTVEGTAAARARPTPGPRGRPHAQAERAPGARPSPHPSYSCTVSHHVVHGVLEVGRWPRHLRRHDRGRAERTTGMTDARDLRIIGSLVEVVAVARGDLLDDADGGRRRIWRLDDVRLGLPRQSAVCSSARAARRSAVEERTRSPRATPGPVAGPPSTTPVTMTPPSRGRGKEADPGASEEQGPRVRFHLLAGWSGTGAQGWMARLQRPTAARPQGNEAEQPALPGRTAGLRPGRD